MLNHFFVSSTDGALYDTRRADWPNYPLRPVYRRTFSEIRNTAELRATLRAGPAAWPGGHPLYFVTSDGAALSFETVRANYAEVSRAVRDRSNDGWRVIGTEINFEDVDLVDDHTGARIPCAYGE